MKKRKKGSFAKIFLILFGVIAFVGLIGTNIYSLILLNKLQESERIIKSQLEQAKESTTPLVPLPPVKTSGKLISEEEFKVYAKDIIDKAEAAGLNPQGVGAYLLCQQKRLVYGESCSKSTDEKILDKLEDIERRL